MRQGGDEAAGGLGGHLHELLLHALDVRRGLLADAPARDQRPGVGMGEGKHDMASRDGGRLGDAVAEAPGRCYIEGAQVGADERDPLVSIVEDERAGQERVVDPLGPLRAGEVAHHGGVFRGRDLDSASAGLHRRES